MHSKGLLTSPLDDEGDFESLRREEIAEQHVFRFFVCNTRIFGSELGPRPNGSQRSRIRAALQSRLNFVESFPSDATSCWKLIEQQTLDYFCTNQNHRSP